MRKKHRLTYVPPSPSGLVEDLAEIIQDEQIKDAHNQSQSSIDEETVAANRKDEETETNQSYSNNNTVVRNGFMVNINTNTTTTPMSPVKKSLRKSLIQSWNESENMDVDDGNGNGCSTMNSTMNSDRKFEKKIMPFELETPSKFLNTSDSTDVCLANTLCEDDILLTVDDDHQMADDDDLINKKVMRSSISLDPKWESVVCGQTSDQQYMVRQAHACLKKFGLTPRTLNFEKPIIDND